MNLIIYTIQHTGTHFLVQLIKTTNYRIKFIPDCRMSSKGRTDLNINSLLQEDDNCESIAECYPVTSIEEWLQTVALKYINSKNYDILIFQCHCKQPNSELGRYLKESKSTIPILSSCRDPLLSILSIIYRSNETFEEFQKSRGYLRLGRIVAHTERFNFLLSIPNDNIYLLPVDIINKEKASNILNSVGLTYSNKTKEYIKEWQPENKTTEWLDRYNRNNEINLFIELKQAVIEKDTVTIKKYLGIEFDYLQRQEKLKEQLYNIGYRDLTWW